MMREDIERFNEWWFTGVVRPELAPRYRRRAFQRLVNSFGERQALLITGLRRVGKTTLMYQAIEELLKTCSPEKVLYFSFDEATVNPKELLRFYEQNVLRKPFENVDRAYIFFDEVQYAAGWPSVVKQFYDLYPNLKFILSGSSTLLLSTEAVQKLAGRFFTLKLKPLTFTEFLEIKTSGRPTVSQRALLSYFNEYLTKAGFPEVVNWENENKVAEYVKNSVVERVVFRDIPSIFRTRNLELMNNLIKQTILTPGITVNINHLSRTLGETRIVISNYLKHLETTMVVRALANYRPSTASASRKLKKYYPATSALTFAYSKRDFYEKMGAVLETYVVNALDAQYYFRDGRREVDVVLIDDRLTLVEVKQSAGLGDVARMAETARLLKAGKAVIISYDQEFVKNNVEVVPAYSLESTPLYKRAND